MSCAQSTLSTTWPHLPGSPEDTRAGQETLTGKPPSVLLTEQITVSNTVLVFHTPGTNSSMPGLPLSCSELQLTEQAVKPGLAFLAS